MCPSHTGSIILLTWTPWTLTILMLAQLSLLMPWMLTPPMSTPLKLTCFRCFRTWCSFNDDKFWRDRHGQTVRYSRRSCRTIHWIQVALLITSMVVVNHFPFGNPGASIPSATLMCKPHKYVRNWAKLPKSDQNRTWMHGQHPHPPRLEISGQDRRFSPLFPHPIAPSFFIDTLQYLFLSVPY